MRIIIHTSCVLAVLFAFDGKTEAQDFGDGGNTDDPVRRLLLTNQTPPKDIFEIRQRLIAHGGKLKSHLVVNGGHDNPQRADDAGVKFMCFETYSNALPDKKTDDDELFFGFFLGAANRTLVVSPGFVELIAWDRTKQVYNFWELIGARWHYRGDSNDILTNIAKINMGDANPKFTFVRNSPTDRKRVLRCSGCHTFGGPIMKELEAPHNDWWTNDRKLNLGHFRLQIGNDIANPAHVAARLFDENSEATTAEDLSDQVKKGIERLISARFRQGGGQNLKQQLRPLFSTMEINLISDGVPFNERIRKNENIAIPLDFFVDGRLVKRKQPIAVNVALYREALGEVGSQFAANEIAGLQESHHAFLIPARSYIDNQVIDALIDKGILDEELVCDVLAVDYTTPIFSSERASLIRYVPDEARDADDLRQQLMAALQNAPPTDRAAQELIANLSDASRTAAAHREKASSYLTTCANAATSREVVVDWLKVASQRRNEIEAAETARHPDGVITERDFRVIFPIFERVTSKAGELRLDPKTGKAVPNAS